MSYKNFTLKDLSDVVLNLINESEDGVTTSLDVKRQLRVDGFWATQKLVSNGLQNIVNDVNNNIVRQHNGSFFIYTLETDEDVNCLNTYDELDDDELDDDSIVDDSHINKPVVKTKNKVIKPLKILSGLFQLVVKNPDGEEVNIILSSYKKVLINSNIVEHYKIIDSANKEEVWTLYTNKPEDVTRHQAMYYSWYLLKEFFDSNVKYSNLRTRKFKPEQTSLMFPITGTTF